MFNFSLPKLLDFSQYRRLPVWEFAPLLLSIFIYFGFVYQWHRRVVDDAFITFRFARNLAEGMGFVWNVGGEPVEGFTSMLHVLLLALGMALGIPPQAWALIISIGAILVTIGLMLVVIRRQVGHVSPFAVGALGIFLVDRISAIHSTSGMETLLFGALLCGSYFAALRFLETPKLNWAISLSILAFLSVLARPEGVLYGAMLYLVLFTYFGYRRLNARENRGLLLIFGSALATASLGFAYLGWKLVYFGYLLPNSFYVKSGQLALYGLTEVLFSLGHLLIWFGPITLLGLVFAIIFTRINGLALPKSAASWAKICLTLAPPILGLVYYSTIKHEVGFAFRFTYPTYLYLVLALSIFLTMLAGSAQNRVALKNISLVVVMALIVLQGAVLQGFLRTEEKWPTVLRQDEYHLTIASALKNTGLGPRASVITVAAGEIPYLSSFTHFDPVGLTDNFLSGREPRSLQEKEEYLWSRKADVFVGFQPPATQGSLSFDDDPVMQTAYISQALAERRTGFVTDLNFPNEPDVLHRRMRELRDNWVWLGDVDWGGWQVLRLRSFIYVRKDSPHRDALISNLKPIISLEPHDIDLNDRPPALFDLSGQPDPSLLRKIRMLGLDLIPR